MSVEERLYTPRGPPSTSGLGHHPFKVAARVRIPLGACSRRRGYSSLDVDQRLIELSVACRSISASSSSLNSEPVEGRDVVLQLRDARRTDQRGRHPLRRAVPTRGPAEPGSARARTRMRTFQRPDPLATAASVSSSGESELGQLARDPSGMPSRYLLVSIPCASGEKTMHPMPSSPTASRRSGSIQADRAAGSEGSSYAGAACRGRGGSRRPRASSPPRSDEDARRRAPSLRERPSRARPSSPRAACSGSKRCRSEDDDVLETHAGESSGRGFRQQVLPAIPTSPYGPGHMS